jgi:hypothetical protein
MQPPEPPPRPTSLELPSEPRVETPVSAPSELELPPSAASPVGPPEQSEPARVDTPSGRLGELVVAHFRRVEIAMLGRVLITTLAGALPPSMVALERRRSLVRRLSRRTGEPIGITVTAGERVLSFRSPELGVAEASVGHTVHGVVLSSTSVPLAQWLDELGELLEQVTREDEAARTALERALLS